MSSHPTLSFAARCALPLLVLALSGCAGQMAFRDGEQLIAKNQVEAGLAKLREAVDKEPGNGQYRIAYLRSRDNATRAWLDQADNARAAGNAEQALASWQRVQSVDPANERARAGIAQLMADARHDKLLAAAEEALERKDPDAARRKVAEVLGERPGHDKARALMRTISDRFPPAPPAESAMSAMFKKPISIEFKDAPLRQVFDVVARSSGLNFVFDKDVKSDLKASITLKNSTVEAAIYYLLMANQLEQQVVDGNTIMIYPNLPAKLKEYQEMVVKTFFLSNADAKVVANTLKTILKSRDVVVDEKLNLLIVRDSAEAIRLAEKLVALQDVSEPEVMLEVEVLEVKRSSLTKLGITWPELVGFAPIQNITLSDLRKLNSDTIGVANIAATVNARKTDNDANTLANPRIRVRNKEKAKVVIGEKVPTITTTFTGGQNSFASESFTYTDVGLTLNVEPTIYLNNEVGIKIGLVVSSLLGSVTTTNGSVGYRIGTREASTLLQLKDGENQVLAGLINSEDRTGGLKVPLMGDLPIVGRLFGTTTDDSVNSEIVLSITPRLIRNIQRPEASASEFSAGTESSFRRRPDSTVRVTVPTAPPALTPAAAPVAAPAMTPVSQPAPAQQPAQAAPPVPTKQQ
jgi:general secretion pathway protein D